MISITDADGKTVKTLYPGQQATGSHLISWDGTDNNGDAVEDGNYTYTVLANTGSGYAEVPSSITGTVSGVAYNNGKAYLVVQGILLDLESVTAVSNIDTSGGSESALNYLGKTVTSNSPIVLVEDGDVSGNELNFNLDAQNEVTIKIYDVYDELVKTITVSADDTVAGENKVEWNGLSDSGYKAEDGLYYYTAKADSSYAKTPVSEEVSGIKYVNGGQYLVMKDSGRLVSLSTITGIN
jgi:flagellar basal-body rod modification protein FlgD